MKIREFFEALNKTLNKKQWLLFNKKAGTKKEVYLWIAYPYFFSGVFFGAIVAAIAASYEYNNNITFDFADIIIIAIAFVALLLLIYTIYYNDKSNGYIDAIHEHSLKCRKIKAEKLGIKLDEKYNIKEE
jgi:hypothetical protein